MKNFKIFLTLAIAFSISSLSNAALVNYKLSGMLNFQDSGGVIDVLDLDRATVEITFDYDDEATRTKTNGSNLDGFTAVSDIEFNYFRFGSSASQTTPANNLYQIAELDSNNRYWINFDIQTSSSWMGFIDSAEAEYMGGFQSTGSSSSSASNVFDPVATPSIAESFRVMIDGPIITLLCANSQDEYCEMEQSSLRYDFEWNSLQITPVASEVPIPATAWLFGSALMSIVMARRKR
jgi:hypothetical protein